MEKPMRNVGDQTVTPSQLGSDAHRDAFQTATLQTEVTESNLLKPDDGGHGGGVTLSGEVRPDGWSFHLKAEQPWYRPEEMRLQALPLEIRRLICIDIALHYGDAAYGNIGSANRLRCRAAQRTSRAGFAGRYGNGWETLMANPPIKLLKSKGHGSPVGTASNRRFKP